MLNYKKIGNRIWIPLIIKEHSMKEHEKSLIQKALNYQPIDIFCLGIDTSNGETSKHDIFIDTEFFSNSTIAIWQTKGLLCPQNNQYIKYNHVIMEFEIGFACFTNPYIDLYFYSFKRCV